MLPSRRLLFLALITLSTVHANILSRNTGKASLRIATSFNRLGPCGNVAERDRARIRTVAQAKPASSIEITNGGLAFTAEVGIGSPPTYYSLLVDTGSANTWVGANKTYVQTNSSHDTGNNVTVIYGSANFTGIEWTDTVTLSPGLVIRNQSIGVANSSFGFQGYDGILAVGPTDRSVGTVSNTPQVPTVMDNLYAQGTISEEVLGLYLVPASEPNSNGELTFGGVDDSVITQPVQYVPLTTAPSSSSWWGINQTITYGSETILNNGAGIIDTGTTLILLAADAFQKYQTLTGGILDNSTGLLTITSDQYHQLKPLAFHIGTETYELSPNAQIWPRSLNSVIGGLPGVIYLNFGNLGTMPNAPAFDFVNGYAFLERFYSVYDTARRRVGFAPTHYTDASTN